ncbi:MAG: glyceraldehyde 3-phosphate dehydrogenase NAD-binding domain-containing protein [Acidobacteriota bacterium]|nr:glyceraldehyde 3-phosphate dehydrogenase NAD-binding domain-containing protein [Acidobacteriota bacterium]
MRVGLMGFGRIGRSLFRILYNHPTIEVGAISDVADPEAMEYLLKFDTILGRFPDEVRIRDGHLYVVGKQIPMLTGAAPGDVAWGDLGVDIVIEATSRVRGRAELARHLDRGAKRVILCSPPIDAPDLTVVMGVNDDRLRPEHRIVSNGSVTAHCAAPILKILHEAFGVRRAFLTTVHAYTNQQRLADVPSEDKRRGRAAAENIIPQETNADEVLMELLPELAGRISGLAMNVPVRNGSVVDLVCWHERPVTVTAINEVVRTAAASERWRPYVEFEDDPIVSSDILRTHYSSVFDSLSTMVIGDRLSKTLSWYDNGWGYSHRVVDLIQRFAEMEGEVSR